MVQVIAAIEKEERENSIADSDIDMGHEREPNDVTDAVQLIEQQAFFVVYIRLYWQMLLLKRLEDSLNVVTDAAELDAWLHNTSVDCKFNFYFMKPLVDVLEEGTRN